VKRAKTTLPPSSLPRWKTVLKIEPEMPPIVIDEYGRARVRGEHLPLEFLVAMYDRGDRVEDIHGAYPWLPLEVIHAVLAWILSHRAEVDEYMRECDRLEEETRRLVAPITAPREQVEAAMARGREMLKKRSAS